MHASFSSGLYSKPSILVDPDRRKQYLKLLEPLADSEDIPDGVVWDIVCRWHGMHLLFDLYIDKDIAGAYSLSRFSYTSAVFTTDTTELSANEEDTPKPSRVSSAYANTMVPEDKKYAYERFYKALTAQWIAVEKLWKVRSQVWQNAQAFDDAFDSAIKTWTNNPARPFEEKLDIVEIVDFVWGFLGRKTFDLSSVSSWLEGDLVREQYIDQTESEVGNWGFFVRSVIQFLRPPQIIQLVLSSWYPSSWNYERPEFLRNLGVFDTWEGILVDAQESPMSDNWIPLHIVDDDVGNSFLHMVNAKEITERWESYRDSQWSAEIKGNLFLRRNAEREVLCRITGTEG